MPSDDQIKHFIFDNTDIRGEIVTLSESYSKVAEHNPLPASVQQLLGQFLAAASLMSGILKFDGILTLQAKGKGPLSLIMAECTHHKNFRGIAQIAPGADINTLTEADIRSLLGDGILTITIDPDKGERYQGIVPLESDSLAGCLEHYFQQSEQLSTRFWFAADNERCTGLLLQALPRQITASEEQYRENWETACHLTDTVKSTELLELEHDSILYRLYNEYEIRLFEPAPVQFACSCSKERSGWALTSLGKEEAHRLLAEQETITIDCQFCNKCYQFDAKDVTDLFGDKPGLLH